MRVQDCDHCVLEADPVLLGKVLGELTKLLSAIEVDECIHVLLLVPFVVLPFLPQSVISGEPCLVELAHASEGHPSDLEGSMC